MDFEYEQRICEIQLDGEFFFFFFIPLSTFRSLRALSEEEKSLKSAMLSRFYSILKTDTG